MAGDHDTGPDFSSQVSSLPPPEIPGNPSPLRPTVNRQNSDIDTMTGESLHKAIEGNSVPTVVDAPPAKLENVAHEFVSSLAVKLSVFVGGRYANTAEPRELGFMA